MWKHYFRWTLPAAVVVLALLVTLNLASTSSAEGRSAKALEKVLEVQDRHTDGLMAIEGVVGTATGLGPEGTPAVLVLTKAPGIAGIPRSLDSVPVIVKVTGEIRALKGPPPGKRKPDKGEKIDPTSRFERPVPIGVSTGNEGECSAGTIGARVKDTAGNVYALSNNHVYALENSAPIDSRILQPGLYDTGCNFDENNVIGTLADFEPLKFRGWARNKIDAAIALSSTGQLGNATPLEGYGTPSSEIVPAVIGLGVQKYGRTTRLTKGEITGINATVRVGYDSGIARFVDQIIVESDTEFIGPGDSGSLLVTDDAGCNPVGLLFAGNDSGTLAVANRIDLVLKRFNVTIDDEEVTPNEPPTVSITSPADGSTFDSGATILFEGTASDTEDEDLTGSLVWTSNIDSEIDTGGSFSAILTDGNHTITAEATDSGDKTASDSISITVGAPPPGNANDIYVWAIDFSEKRLGRRRPRIYLTTTVTIRRDSDASGSAEDTDEPVSNARVEMTLSNDNGKSWNFAGDSGDDGTVKFTKKYAKKGTYTATVTNVQHSTYTYNPTLNVETSDSHTIE